MKEKRAKEPTISEISVIAAHIGGDPRFAAEQAIRLWEECGFAVERWRNQKAEGAAEIRELESLKKEARAQKLENFYDGLKRLLDSCPTDGAEEIDFAEVLKNLMRQAKLNDRKPRFRAFLMEEGGVGVIQAAEWIEELEKRKWTKEHVLALRHSAWSRWWVGSLKQKRIKAGKARSSK